MACKLLLQVIQADALTVCQSYYVVEYGRLAFTVMKLVLCVVLLFNCMILHVMLFSSYVLVLVCYVRSLCQCTQTHTDAPKQGTQL